MPDVVHAIGGVAQRSLCDQDPARRGPDWPTVTVRKESVTCADCLAILADLPVHKLVIDTPLSSLLCGADMEKNIACSVRRANVTCPRCMALLGVS
jgi:hypothetical protein